MNIYHHFNTSAQNVRLPVYRLDQECGYFAIGLVLIVALLVLKIILALCVQGISASTTIVVIIMTMNIYRAVPVVKLTTAKNVSLLMSVEGVEKITATNVIH